MKPKRSSHPTTAGRPRCLRSPEPEPTGEFLGVRLDEGSGCLWHSPRAVSLSVGPSFERWTNSIVGPGVRR